MNENETTEFVEADNIDQIDEAAADTLKPGAGSGGTESKAQTLATFTSLLSQLGKEDLSKLFNDVQAQYGANKAPGAEDKSAANRASVDAKASAAVGKGAWKEDVDDMFSGEDLSEDFRERAEVVFEAAVNTRMSLETARLEEEFAVKETELEEAYELALSEAVVAINEDITGKLDKYLDYVVENWVEENRIALETSLRAEIAENFISSLRNVFAEHYITVPDDKLDLVAEMKSELESVKATLSETLNENIEMKNVLDEATRQDAINDAVTGLVETQAEKVRALAEGIDFTDEATFRRKLELVKESFTATKTVSTGIINEEIDGTDSEENETVVPAHMQRYVSAISKSVKL